MRPNMPKKTVSAGRETSTITIYGWSSSWCLIRMRIHSDAGVDLVDWGIQLGPVRFMFSTDWHVRRFLRKETR